MSKIEILSVITLFKRQENKGMFFGGYLVIGNYVCVCKRLLARGQVSGTVTGCPIQNPKTSVQTGHRQPW